MSLKERCNIVGLKFSPRSIAALDLIDSKVGLANQLSGVILVSPMIDIFSGGKANLSQVSKDVYSYDWEQLADALGSTNDALKRMVYDTAVEEALYSDNYKEREFWACVSDIAR